LQIRTMLVRASHSLHMNCKAGICHAVSLDLLENSLFFPPYPHLMPVLRGNPLEFLGEAYPAKMDRAVW